MSSVRFAALFISLAQSASASSLRAPVCAAQAPVPVGATWTAPLDRVVSFHASEISLKDALDRLAAQARFRISYSGEFVPLDRPVCLAMDSAPLGDVLTALLAGTGVEPVSAAADYVVLSPPKSPIVAVAHPIMLDRIVVTGTAAGGSQRPLPVALDVINPRDLSLQSVNNLGDALSATVPGEFLWASSPTSLLAQYGSIRGASSFGLSYPKVYIDGIEVANPLLLTRLSPDAIDRVEVIRGPQGAALYGADAISGITNIVSRQDAAQDGEPRVRWQSDVGAAASDFVTNPTLRQNHALSLRTGTGTTTGGLNLSYGSDGAFVPDAYARAFSALGNVRAVTSDVIWTGIVRFFDEQAASPVSPLLLNSVGANGLRVTAPGTQSVVEYTAGTTLKYTPSDEWKHTFTVGVDGYTLNGLPDDGTPFPSAADSALLAARGSALRATLRASSVLAMDLGQHATGDITLSLEQSELRQAITTTAVAVPVNGGSGGPGRGGPARSYMTPAGRDSVDWRSNTALTGLVSTGLADRVFLSGGVRLEQATGVDGTVIPMVGAAWVNDIGPATLKLRAAYGKGVRFPNTTPRQTMYEDLRSALGLPPQLQPEEQSGIEAGADLAVGRVLTLQLTRFDQTATGLIQRVAMTHDTASAPSGYGSGGPPQRQMYTELQNVGDVTNRGWEMSAGLHGGPFALTGTLSIVDSRVKSLSVSYAGDLQVGDRMLEVPARTMSLTASFAGGRWGGAFTVYGAQDWINYDRLALAEAYASTTAASRSLVGPALRNYWHQYDGIAHMRASVSFLLRPGLTWALTGDNLLDRQTGEPDNVTVLPGRTISVGLRAQF